MNYQDLKDRFDVAMIWQRKGHYMLAETALKSIAEEILSGIRQNAETERRVQRKVEELLVLAEEK